jgi:hypothetical protein
VATGAIPLVKRRLWVAQRGKCQLAAVPYRPGNRPARAIHPVALCLSVRSRGADPGPLGHRRLVHRFGDCGSPLHPRFPPRL